jgi:hypothetical protein
MLQGSLVPGGLRSALGVMAFGVPGRREPDISELGPGNRAQSGSLTRSCFSRRAGEAPRSGPESRPVRGGILMSSRSGTGARNGLEHNVNFFAVQVVFLGGSRPRNDCEGRSAVGVSCLRAACGKFAAKGQ